MLFPGYRVDGAGAFRVLRDSDLEIEEEAEDLVRYFANAIKRRRRGRVIRLKLETNLPDALAAALKEELGGADAIITESGDLLGLIADLDGVVDEDRPDLKFPPYSPRFPERIREFGGDCFAAIRAKDIVVHHPYETFDVVLAFLRQAAADPDVVAIKQTLYRAGKAVRGHQRADRGGGGGQVGHRGRRAEGALRRGAEHALGLRAGAGRRAGWSMASSTGRRNAKVSLVVRRESGAVPDLLPFRHRQLSPDHRASIYTDLSFFTADQQTGRDAAQMFNYITGYVEPVDMKVMSLSPRNLRRQAGRE